MLHANRGSDMGMTRTRTRSRPVEADPRFADVTLRRAAARWSLYDARDVMTACRVSLKVPIPDSPWSTDAILQESALLARVGAHPHVVTLYDHIRLRDGRPVLVLEPGMGSFGDLTGAYRPRLEMIVAAGIKLCGALETLHGAGFLHTNVCPTNVIVTESGALALAGFDQAVPIVGAEMHALHETTSHTAPELLEGGTPTCATDVYGLAVTMYEVAAGHPAFPAYDGEPTAETSLRILRGRHAPLPPEIPLPIADLLEWGMAVDPHRRPPTAAWFAEELRRFEQSQGWERTAMVTGTAFS